MRILSRQRRMHPELRARVRANVDAVAPFLQVASLTKGPFFIADSFHHAYRREPPESCHHYVAFYRRAADHFVALGYALMYPYANLTLVAGSLTDGRRFEHVTTEHSNAIRESGGVKVLVLSQAIMDLGKDCEAFFAYSGNERARAANRHVGFEQTEHQYLMGLFHKPTRPRKKRKLIAEAQRMAPF